MFKNHIPWLRATIVFQLLMGLVHALSFFNKPNPGNETEEQLIRLITEYRMDMGAGYMRSMHELFMSLSISYSLFFLFCGLLNWLLMRYKAGAGMLRGIVNLQLVVFGACAVVMLIFAFLPPIVLSVLVFVCLAGTRAALVRKASAA